MGASMHGDVFSVVLMFSIDDSNNIMTMDQ